NKKLITILAIVIVAGGGILVLTLNYSPAGPSSELDSFTDSDRMARQILEQSADINNIRRALQSFYQDDVLRSLTSYAPTELPPRWGRVNPFIPFLLEQRLVAEREAGLQDLRQQQQQTPIQEENEELSAEE
ncbi:MAG: hypothetical protein WDZ39_00315, partial [Candidatus Spechtbacterales bacterium]